MTSKSRLPGDVADELPRELIELGKRIAGMPDSYQRDLEPIPGRYARVTPSKWRRKGRQVPSLVDNPVAVSWVAIPVVDSPAQVFTGPGNDHDVLLPSDLAPGAR